MGDGFLSGNSLQWRYQAYYWFCMPVHSRRRRRRRRGAGTPVLFCALLHLTRRTAIACVCRATLWRTASGDDGGRSGGDISSARQNPSLLLRGQKTPAAAWTVAAASCAALRALFDATMANSVKRGGGTTMRVGTVSRSRERVLRLAFYYTRTARAGGGT